MVSPIELIPEHELLDGSEVKKVLVKFRTSLDKLPKIYESDAQAIKLNAKQGSVIAVHRKDPTGDYIIYRLVVKD